MRNSSSLKVLLAVSAALCLAQPLLAQREGDGPIYDDKPPPPDKVPLPPPPPPVVTPPPPPPTTITIPTPPGSPFTPSVFVPTDVTNSSAMVNAHVPRGEPPIPSPVKGLFLLKNNDFPEEENNKDSTDGILVRAEEDAKYTRPSPYSVNLNVGGILVSVKRPSQLAWVKTEIGPIAIAANGDTLVRSDNGVLRVMNVDGLGKSVRVKLNMGPFSGSNSKVVGLRPGYELIAALRPLRGADLRPRDGLARRKASVVLKGFAAVNQFSIDSLLDSCTLVVAMRQNVSGIKERRILSDMSKMAAVTNVMEGTHGFRRESAYQLAETKRTN